MRFHIAADRRAEASEIFPSLDIEDMKPPSQLDTPSSQHDRVRLWEEHTSVQ